MTETTRRSPAISIALILLALVMLIVVSLVIVAIKKNDSLGMPPLNATVTPPPPRKAAVMDVAPGGDRQLSADRFQRAYLSEITGAHSWYLQDNRFILQSERGDLSRDLLDRLLGPQANTGRVSGHWRLDSQTGEVLLQPRGPDGSLSAEPKKLAMSPAGALRVNLDVGYQYNVYSFNPQLPPPQPGVTFPIYSWANRIDREFLRGKWSLIVRTIDGQDAPADSIKDRWLRVDDHSWISNVETASADETNRVSWEINAVPTPRTLDLIGPMAEGKDRRRRAIYQWNGDELTICVAPENADRPNSFAPAPGQGWIVETYRPAPEVSETP